MITILEHLYDNDKRALADFVNCTDHCDDCRAREICDRYVAFGDNGISVTEAQFLMMPWEMPSAGEASMMSVNAHISNQFEKELFALKLKVDELSHNHEVFRKRLNDLSDEGLA